MENSQVKEAQTYLLEHYEELVELLTQLCAIPAPSHREENRAAFCKEWLEKNGAKGVHIDEAKNVVYPIGCEGDGELVVFMAHTDTVFPDLEPMPLTTAEGKMHCPGVGDDTANLAVLLMVAKYVTLQKLKPTCGVLFVANSCEEGLGNLKGSRQLMEDYGKRVRQVVSFDGYYTAVANNAVGSTRYQVELKTEGGHSYGDFGNRSAIAYLASMIETLYTIKAPAKAKTTYNVGVISGGTSVNTIAQQAEMLYEYRSEDRECLEIMERFFESVVETYRASGITVHVKLLGQRPCSKDLDEEKMAALTQECASVLTQCTGKAPRVEAGSTDCNIPLSMGIPAACVGLCLGGGAHTREEWIQLESLKVGCSIAAKLVLAWF